MRGLIALQRSRSLTRPTTTCCSPRTSGWSLTSPRTIRTQWSLTRSWAQTSTGFERVGNDRGGENEELEDVNHKVRHRDIPSHEDLEVDDQVLRRGRCRVGDGHRIYLNPISALNGAQTGGRGLVHYGLLGRRRQTLRLKDWALPTEVFSFVIVVVCGFFVSLQEKLGFAEVLMDGQFSAAGG